MLYRALIKILLLTVGLIINSCAKHIYFGNSKHNSYSPVNIKIYEQTRRHSLGPCEPSIAINPVNTNNMVVGSVLDYVHTSNDSGKTWQTQQLKSKYGVWGDPTLLCDFKGNFYYFHLSDPEGTNWKSKKILDRIVVQKSSDNGKTWSKGTGIGLNAPKQQDKQGAVINPKQNNQLYTAWTEFDKYSSNNKNDKSRILFSKSINSGKTWSKPIQISNQEGNCLDNDLTPEGTTLASDGNNLYMSWAYNSKIWFAKSTDNGNNWSKEIAIANQPNGWKYNIKNLARCNGFPVISIDQSNSKHKGTVYINWSTQINETQTNIFISKSLNKGITWSTPKIVNTNKKTAHHFFNWMCNDTKTGYIYIVYYKEVKPKSSLIEVHLSVSKNGAKSFKDFTISKQSFNPKGATFFGDYNSITAYNGIIRPVWTQVNNGMVSIWTALIEQHHLK